MKFFIEKNFWFKLIITLCICLTIFNFALPPKARAAAGVSALGGKLLDPVVDLMLVLGDGVIEVIQKSIMGTGTGLIFDNIKGNWLDAIKAALKLIVSVIAGILLTAAAAWLAAFIPVIGAIIAAGLTSGIMVVAASLGSYYVLFNYLPNKFLPDNIYLPTFYISPEEIFAGKVLLFDVNIFSPEEVYVNYDDDKVMTKKEWDELNRQENEVNDKTFNHCFYYKNGVKTDENKVVTSVNNSAYELKETIAKWYYTIRNIALVALMSVLVYIGIRMLTSSLAAEKAKYKQMLSDWIIAMCLILLMQYIMVFANTFVKSIVTILGNVTDNQAHTAIVEGTDKLIEQLKDQGLEDLVDDNTNTISWPTNLMGNMRVMAQQKDGTAAYIGYAICYLILVAYTAFFSFTYLKRLLYILFLTVISPLVALTYPIDKVRDGQAQAFNMWLKEYTYNLLIQPFHLLLYVIFVTMAIDLSGDNIVYSLVVIGFMVPAEKLLRNMFGFNKASTPGFLAGPAGAAMTISAMKSLAGFANGGKGKKTSGGSGDSSKIRNTDSAPSGDMATKGMGALLDDASNELNGTTNNNNDADTGNDDTRTQNGGTTGGQTGSPNGKGQNDNTPNPNDDAGDMPNLEDEDRDIFEYLKEEKWRGSLPQRAIDGARNGASNLAGGAKDFARNRVNSIDRAMSRHKPLRLVRNTASKGWGTLKATGKAAADRIDLKENMAKAVKTGAKFTVGGAAAGIATAAGIAATGNPAEAFKYGVAGAYAGASIGEGTVNKVSGASDQINSFNRDKKIYRDGIDKYKEAQTEKANKEFMKDKEARKVYAQKLNLKNKADIDKVMEDACDYRKYGVTDNDTIIKAMKLAGTDTAKRASKENIAAAKLSSISKSEKDLTTNLKRYQKVPGISQANVDAMEAKIRKINNM